MVTLSEQVQTQIGNAKTVIAAGNAHGDAIAQLGAQEVRDGSAEKIAGSMTLLVTHLKDKTDELDQAEKRYMAEQATMFRCATRGMPRPSR